MKKVWFLAALCLILVVAAAVCMMNFVWVGGKPVAKTTQSLDLSHQRLPELTQLSKLQNLKELDLVGTGLTPEQYEALRQALPGCDIRWLVPFQGAFYPTDTANLTVTHLTAEDVAILAYLPRLRTVDATACRDYEALSLLQSSHPACRIHYSVDLGGQTLPEDATELSVTLDSVAELEAALSLLPKLERITVTGCRDALGLEALRKKFPQISIHYDIYLGAFSYPNTTQRLTLEASLASQLSQVVGCFQNLQDVTLTGSGDTAALHALANAAPEVRFHYGFQLLGKDVHTDDTELSLAEMPLENTRELEAALPYFHNLKRLDLRHCGISNEDMAVLRDRHPNTQVVWMVTLGGIEVPTDLTAFIPYRYGTKLDDERSKNLKYLTELICLDLGHNEITDFSFLNYMPKLEYLLLADTDISDISACANMPNLRYLELFLTKVRDLSPLASISSLEYVNISYTYPRDVTPLCGHKNMKYLWMRGYEFTDQQNQLLAALPNANINFSHGPCTDGGWRQTEEYFIMRDLLGMHYME